MQPLSTFHCQTISTAGSPRHTDYFNSNKASLYTDDFAVSTKEWRPGGPDATALSPVWATSIR